MDVSAACICACWGKLAGRKPLSNEQNNSERFSNYPVLKIKDPKAGKREQTDEREQLIPPLHWPI